MIAWIVLLVLLVVVMLLAAAGMRRGWRNRAVRQAAILPAFPRPPAGAANISPSLPPATGVYVGTVIAGDWQDRVALGDIGFHAAATLRLSRDGLLIERAGASELWIPAASLSEVRTSGALAGKVLGGERFLVLRWALTGDDGVRHEFETGFRGDDKRRYRDWAAAIALLVADRDHDAVNGGRKG